MLPLTGAQSLVMSLSFRTFSLGSHLFFSGFFLYVIVDALFLLNLRVSGDSAFGCSCVLAKDLECLPWPSVSQRRASHQCLPFSIAFFQWDVHSLLFFSPAPPLVFSSFLLILTFPAQSTLVVLAIATPGFWTSLDPFDVVFIGPSYLPRLAGQIGRPQAVDSFSHRLAHWEVSV